MSQTAIALLPLPGSCEEARVLHSSSSCSSAVSPIASPVEEDANEASAEVEPPEIAKTSVPDACLNRENSDHSADSEAISTPPASLKPYKSIAARRTSSVLLAIRRVFRKGKVSPWSSSDVLPNPTGVDVVQSKPVSKSVTLQSYLGVLADNQDLTSEDAETAFRQILDGADDLQVGAFLMLLTMKGETNQEIAGMVRAMNLHKAPTSGPILDIVRGREDDETFSIATASRVLASACGCKVVKTQRRPMAESASVKTLVDLGIVVNMSPNQAENCVKQCGIAYVKDLESYSLTCKFDSIQQRIGVEICPDLMDTIELLPGAQHAVIGVLEHDHAPLVANVLECIGHVEHALVIHSFFGIGDMLSPLGPANIFELKNVAPPGEKKDYETKEFTFDPVDLGISWCAKEDLSGNGCSKQFCEDLAGGTKANGARRDAIVLNAGVACYVYGEAESIAQGVCVARNAVESGKALDVLEKWNRASKTPLEQQKN